MHVNVYIFEYLFLVGFPEDQNCKKYICNFGVHRTETHGELEEGEEKKEEMGAKSPRAGRGEY